MRSHLPTLTRRLVVMVTAGLVVLLLGGFTLVKVRAGQAQDRRDQAAAQAAQDEAARQSAAREAERQAAADQVAAQWAATSADAATRLAAADAVLAGSAAEVADDVVRLALAGAIDAVRSATEPEGDADADAVRQLVEALDVMDLAQTRVTEAQAAWQAEQEAAAARADAARPDPAATLGGPPSTGAGPDCGGPDSYEPPKNTGPTFYTSTPSQTGSGGNGDIPAAQMTPLAWCADSQGNSQWLRSAAAAALTRLNEAFRAEFGENIAVDMSYRSYQTQVEMREAFGTVAATPGQSNHGTGLAFDTWEWQAYAFGTARYDWLVEHGPEYGWVAPDWARQNGSNPEYWHFEYVG